ncbi:hypothetical protein MFLO_07117 [Listeria floridensis FSL S10-1187]|uniref:Uncharacterized protein n=1 Tax=Listeria floridensis FSL S10-1187 TaxID=1265817 RepID=A0ABP3AYM5_9LIST|nr:hypothetical protein [Listeria floridensis]EUJ32296.1 hypothetical protein MFLO_07117 [Listeria floridensis FSL S10-1187]
MIRKRIFVGLTTVVLGCSLVSPATLAYADDVVPVKGVQHAQERTLIVTAHGILSGSIVPYYDKEEIPGLETGFIDLHYHSHDTGFVDGDNSYITIELPQEFAPIAKQASFKENISGRVQRKGLTGEKWFEYSQDDIIVNGTQISFKTPRELWFIHGEVNADISINYGNIQKQYPIRLVRDSSSSEGYQFNVALRRSMAPWDPIQYPIIGDNSDHWQSNYLSAYWD